MGGGGGLVGMVRLGVTGWVKTMKVLTKIEGEGCLCVLGITACPTSMYLNKTAAGSEPLVDMSNMFGRQMKHEFVEDLWNAVRQ